MRLILVPALVLTTSVLSKAQENQNILLQSSSAIIEEPTGSSELNRIEKKWGFLLQPIGVGPTEFFTGGVTFFFFLNKNNSIELSYQNGAHNWSDSALDSSGKPKTSLGGHENTYGVKLKHFFSNTFFVNSGLEQAYYNKFYHTTNYDYNFKGSKSAISVSLGNQWQMKYFTIGCEWIGAQIPFSSSLESEYASYGETAQKELNDEERIKLKNFGLFALRLKLGASF